MDRKAFVFISCCFLSVLSFLVYKYTFAENSWIVIKSVTKTTLTPVKIFEKLQGSMKVDVSKICEKICNRKMKSCVDPAVSVLVYNDTLLGGMDFGQHFDRFVPKDEEQEANMTKWKHKRKLCPVTDLNPSFETMTTKSDCAIIGNSGILLGSGCGKDIDEHSFILRANLAKLTGYADDVGNKTNMMMINLATVRNLHELLTSNSDVKVIEREHMLRYFQSIRGAILWYPKSTGGVAQKLREISTVLMKENVSLQFAYSFTSAVAASKRKWKTKKLPSSGLIALTVAQSFCKNITLYGFYPYQKDSFGAKVLHHYYEPNRTSFHTNVHNFDEEYKLLGKLNDKQLLRRVVGPCKTDSSTRKKVVFHRISSLNQSTHERPPQDQNITIKPTRDQNYTGSKLHGTEVS